MKMKKLIVSMIILATAGVVSAQVVNGDFSSATVDIQNRMADGDADLNQGWMAGSALWSTATGVAVRDLSDLPNSNFAIAQIFSHDLAAGSYKLQFDYNFTNAGDADGGFDVELYFYNNNGSGGSLAYGNRYALNSATTGPNLASQGNYVHTQLINSTIAEGSVTGYQIDFTLAESMGDYDSLAVRFLGTALDGAGTTLSIDNVSIVAGASATQQGSVFIIK